MAAVQETIDQVRLIDVDQYKYGFETIIEMDKAPKGLSEEIIHFILQAGVIIEVVVRVLAVLRLFGGERQLWELLVIGRHGDSWDVTRRLETRVLMVDGVAMRRMCKVVVVTEYKKEAGRGRWRIIEDVAILLTNSKHF